jgi:amino acid permease
MSNTAFYIVAVVALIVAVTLMKYVVSCLMRSVILILTVVALALVYYFFVGQYDPEMHDAVEQAVEKYGHHGKTHQ